jgi:hypothetical protein
MTLYNYIRRRSHNDITFVEFNRNPNFISNNILHDVVARSRNHGNCNPYRMNFIHDRIADSLME